MLGRSVRSLSTWSTRRRNIHSIVFDILLRRDVTLIYCEKSEQIVERRSWFVVYSISKNAVVEVLVTVWKFERCGVHHGGGGGDQASSVRGSGERLIVGRFITGSIR